MALNSIIIDTLLKLPRPQGEARALSAGYPDIIIEPALLKSLMGEAADRIPAHPDSASILEWHHKERYGTVPDSAAFFAEIGYRLEVIDIVATRGVERVVDLNRPQIGFPLYDLVIDPGTIEHCFNIAQAAMNLASAVSQDGRIVQVLPMNAYNHGFYNINPTWFYDFYEHNGFVVENLLGYTRATKGHKAVLFHAPKNERFESSPPEASLLCVARRAEMKALSYPTQWKYRKWPTLKMSEEELDAERFLPLESKIYRATPLTFS